MLMYSVCMLLWLWHKLHRQTSLDRSVHSHTQSSVKTFFIFSSVPHLPTNLRGEDVQPCSSKIAPRLMRSNTLGVSRSGHRHECLLHVPECTIAGCCLYKKWRYDRFLPVMLSHRMRDVIIRPYGLNRDSKSCWVMFFGNPETYRFAPFIASELGRAYDTWKKNHILLQSQIDHTRSNNSEHLNQRFMCMTPSFARIHLIQLIVFLTLIVLFCNLNPFSVLIAFSASSGRW